MTKPEEPQGPAKRLLICADWFAPGVRAGGPIRSCVNLTKLLGRSSRITLITSNRDLGCSTPYPTVAANRWHNWNGLAVVQYCDGPLRRMTEFARLCKQHRPDVIYLNSAFSVPGTLWPLFFLWLCRSTIRIILAPRGMLKPSAMSQKIWKKRPLIKLIRWLRITHRVHFHATSIDEIDEIRNAFGNVSVELIPNVPCVPASELPPCTKQAGIVKLCFVGRVHPIKNLLWLIRAMKSVTSTCSLTVIGPIEDVDHYQHCLNAVADLPTNISVTFAGAKAESEIRDVLNTSDAFVLPTLGENFGHAIYEAFAAGTPVIVSDQTIWRDLTSKSAGWDHSLDSPTSFAQTIDEVAKMDNSQLRRWQSGALRVAHEFMIANDFFSQYQKLFFG